jgi:hypothetical protein
MEAEGWSGLPDAELLERLGLAPDTRCALALGRGGPPDPLEPGSSTLELTLLEQDSGAPFASEVVLWRLDAPANGYWTAGDQDVARAEVGREGGPLVSPGLEWLPLLPTPTGFDLGTFPEDTRRQAIRQRVDLRCDGGWSATISLGNAAAGEVLTVVLESVDGGGD